MRIPQLISERGPFVSLEFFPPKKQEEWPAFLDVARQLVPLRPLFASVTYGAGGSTQANTLEICERLMAACGFEIMPHLTGVTASAGKIDGFLQAIRAMGIDNVLALRGDRPAGFTGTDAELFAAFPMPRTWCATSAPTTRSWPSAWPASPRPMPRPPPLPPIWR